jgi:Skp family chaperone for outer membrane proteins
MKNKMKNKSFFLFFLFFMAIPVTLFPITLVRVGYIDLDIIISSYTTKYLNTEISIREEYISQLQTEYNDRYYRMPEMEENQLLSNLQKHRRALNMLKYNNYLWENTEELSDEIIYQIVQRDIMEAIKKTGELEGFSIILDKTGNFIYGSEDVNLTDKVLFRLDEKLLDLQSTEPVAPLSLESVREEGALLLENEEE